MSNLTLADVEHAYLRTEAPACVSPHPPRRQGVKPMLAYTLTEAAEVSRFSVATLRRAVHCTDPEAFPPPLPAKRAGDSPRAKVLILASDLEAWLQSLPDAS